MVAHVVFTAVLTFFVSVVDIFFVAEDGDEDEEDEEENFWELTDSQLKFKAIGLLVRVVDLFVGWFLFVRLLFCCCFIFVALFCFLISRLLNQVVAIAVVSIFSDPMVDVINSFGKAINIPPFYVSFVLTPLGTHAHTRTHTHTFTHTHTHIACEQGHAPHQTS